MSLQEFLQQKHSAATVKIYLFEIKHFISYLGEVRAQKASYEDIINYLSYLRNRYENPATIHRIIYALKQYYFYLIKVEKRTDHPCRYLKLKGNPNTDIQVQDLLSPQELDLLVSHKRKERFAILTLRNRLLISILVYQALLLKEICQLTIEDVNLEDGTLKVHPTPKTNGRTLPLKPQQILLFYRYLNETRPKLLKGKTNKLILTKMGTVEKGEGIHYLCETLRYLFPHKKLSPTTIRQSVIARQLKAGKDLRIVQVFAGHKKPSTTEKYKQSNLEELKKSVMQFHPLQ